MLTCTLTFALTLALAGAPAPQAPPQKKAKKVWTNEDLEALRGKVRLSTFEPAAAPAAATAEGGEAEAGAASAPQAGYQREKDPDWYRQQAAPLRTELDQIDSEIRQIRDRVANPGAGSNAVRMDTGSVGLSPADRIARLEQRRRQVQQRLDELEDQARRNGISPGVLR